MGPVEEAGKAANTFMDALKAQPLSLALVVMNLTLLTFIFYWANAINTQRQESVKMILDVEKQVHELLSRCIVPSDRRSEMGRIESRPLPPLYPLPRPGPEVDPEKPKAVE